MRLCLLLNSGCDEPNRSVTQILPSCSLVLNQFLSFHIGVKALTFKSVSCRATLGSYFKMFTILSGAFHDHTHIPLNELLSDELTFLISNEGPFAPHHRIADVPLWISPNVLSFITYLWIYAILVALSSWKDFVCPSAVRIYGMLEKMIESAVFIQKLHVLWIQNKIPNLLLN